MRSRLPAAQVYIYIYILSLPPRHCASCINGFKASASPPRQWHCMSSYATSVLITLERAHERANRRTPTMTRVAIICARSRQQQVHAPNETTTTKLSSLCACVCLKFSRSRSLFLERKIISQFCCLLYAIFVCGPQSLALGNLRNSTANVCVCVCVPLNALSRRRRRRRQQKDHQARASA